MNIFTTTSVEIDVPLYVHVSCLLPRRFLSSARSIISRAERKSKRLHANVRRCCTVHMYIHVVIRLGINVHISNLFMESAG